MPPLADVSDTARRLAPWDSDSTGGLWREPSRTAGSRTGLSGHAGRHAERASVFDVQVDIRKRSESDNARREV